MLFGFGRFALPARDTRTRPKLLKGPFLVQRTTNEHLRAKRYMAASLPPALSRAVLWHLVARASSLPSGLPCSSSEAPAQIMRSSPETLSLLSVAHSHSRFSPECLTQSILLLDVMGGLWPLLAVLSVPPASSALQQRAATLLQPSSSDTSAAFVMKNSCCTWQEAKVGAANCGEADDRSLEEMPDLRNWTAPMGAERVLRIRANHGSAGFFTYMLIAINQLILAQSSGVTPYVEFGRCTVNGRDHRTSGGRNLYYDERYGENMWEQYFEPVSTFTPRKTAPSVDAPGSGRRRRYDMRSLSSSRIWELQEWTHTSVYAFPYGMYANVADAGYDETWSRMMRTRAASIVQRYIRVKPAIAAKAQAFWRTHFARGEDVLGVHIMPPNSSGVVLGMDAYTAHIDRWSLKHPTSSIFVVSDDASYLPLLRQVYGDRIVVRESVKNDRPGLLEEDNGRYREGEDVLIDVLLLSKCSFLLKSSSAAAEFATYFNPTLAEHSVELQYERAAPNPQAGMSITAAAVETAVETAAAVPPPSKGPPGVETPLETVLNFLVCDTNLCQYGEGCGEYALLANASCVRTEAQIDARTEAQNEIAQRLSNLKPLLTEAEKLFSEMDASMPLREEMPSPEPVHLSLSKMMAELETRSTIARNLAGSSSIGASVDIVIVRCDEEVSPWLPRLVSHFPHDVKVKVVLGEMCQDMCVFQAGVVGSGKAPPNATGGLIEACENPRQEEVLGAKVEHRKFANVGFESAAYIKYIIDNYKTEALADSTLFLQAGWPEHSPRLLDSDVLERHVTTSPFAMYGGLYETLPQKGCTDWCLSSTVWKHILPERRAGFADNGKVGNVGFGLFHAKRSVIEERSLESWELVHRALIGKHEPLNAELCKPLKNTGINMTSLLNSPYGRDLLLMIRGKAPPEVTTPEMVKRLGALLDTDTVLFQGSSVLHSMRTRDRLTAEIQTTSAICSGNKHVVHCPSGFQLGSEACDMKTMISPGVATTTGDKAWPCCDMNGAPEDGVDQALLSLHTRIFYCTATAPEDRGKLMGTAYEHSWHMLFGQQAILPLSMAPLINTYAALGNPAFLDSCPQKKSTIVPTTDTPTRLAAHRDHRRNILHRVIRAGLQVMQGADTQEGRNLCSSSSWSHTATFKAACNWYASSKRLAGAVSLSLVTRGTCTPVQMATRTLMRSTDLCNAGLVRCIGMETEALEKCEPPTHAQLHRTQNMYGTFRELFKDIAENIAPHLRPAVSAISELAGRKTAAQLQATGTDHGSHDGRLDLVLSRCHGKTIETLPMLLNNFDHRLSFRTFIYERCVDNAEGTAAVQGAERPDVWLLPNAVDQRDRLFTAYRFAVAPHARHNELSALHASGMAQMRTIFGHSRTTAKSATLFVTSQVSACANHTSACERASTTQWTSSSRHSMSLCFAEMDFEAKYHGAKETLMEDSVESPVPSWALETELEEGFCAQPTPTIQALGAVSTLIAAASRLYDADLPSPYNAAASALDAERMMVERLPKGGQKRRVLGTPLSCFEPDFMLHNREMMSVATLDSNVCAHNLSAVQPIRMQFGKGYVKTKLLAAGWFSTVMGIVKPMMAAVASGRALLTPGILEFTSNTTCPKRDISCFFSSLVDPKPSDVDQAELIDIEDDSVVYALSEAAGSIPPQYASRGWFWWASKMIEQIIRPSAAVAAAVSHASNATGLTAAMQDSSPIMGLHVRQGDSCLAEEYIRMSRECSNLSTYMEAAMPMIKSAGVKTVYLATDSIQALADTVLYPELKFIHLNTSREAPITKRHKLTLWDVRIKAPSANETKEAEERRLSANEASAFDATVDVLLLAQADILVGKFTSNLFRSAYAMASARCDCIVPFISLDAPWCFDYGRRVGANWDFPVSGETNHTKSDNRFFC